MARPEGWNLNGTSWVPWERAKIESLEIISKNRALRVAFEILLKKNYLLKSQGVVVLGSCGTARDCGGG